MARKRVVKLRVSDEEIRRKVEQLVRAVGNDDGSLPINEGFWVELDEPGHIIYRMRAVLGKLHNAGLGRPRRNRKQYELISLDRWTADRQRGNARQEATTQKVAAMDKSVTGRVVRAGLADVRPRTAAVVDQLKEIGSIPIGRRLKAG